MTLALIVLLPLIGSIISGMFYRIITAKQAHFTTTFLLFVSAALSYYLAYHVIHDKQNVELYLYNWLSLDGYNIQIKLYADMLTAVMCVVVTTVSSLVHLYSSGYMEKDPGMQRFMSYLSLFTFFMLLLVTSDNLIQLFVGWEGVGLCSYLLIGFWYHKETANAAAMKAFIVNRIGDLFLVLGIVMIYANFHTLNLQEIFINAAKSLTYTKTAANNQITIDIICSLLFVGCMGKSAQFILHVWLPDAMEGPTPVSALIHAATMVTAGVFLVVRCAPLFELSVLVREYITYLGAFTAIFAATIAITQQDIKRIIAYSTCSQLGYMFFACGVSAYGVATFHLMTHAFFKALLFLGAGSVIHAIGGEQNIYKMGSSITRKIPFTYISMWIGSLALAGIFPFAGYFSKDLILESAYTIHTKAGNFAYIVGISAAFLTAVYSWRLIFVVFHRKSEHKLHAHESGPSMLIALFLLSIGAIISGWVGSLLNIFELPKQLLAAHNMDLLIKYLPLIVALAGIFVAYISFIIFPNIPQFLSHRFRYIYQYLLNKWYIDEIYNRLFIRPANSIAKLCANIVDKYVIDTVIVGFCTICTSRCAKFVNYLQTGLIYQYGFIMLTFIVIFTTWYIWI